MEQIHWALDPAPVCEICGERAQMTGQASGTLATFDCPNDCDVRFTIDMTTWNEQHGNGFLAKR